MIGLLEGLHRTKMLCLLFIFGSVGPINEQNYLIVFNLLLNNHVFKIFFRVFLSGAMENWGLVTYRETALLVDPEHSSSKAKQWVALVVGHEMAHQWFGNLVTMVTVSLHTSQ